MKKRIVSILVVLTVLAGLFSYPGGQVKVVQAADISAVAGIAAWADVVPLTLDQVKPAFLSVEYQALDGTYLIGVVDIPIYEAEYDPLVMVTTDGLIVAYYPPEDYAGKMVDVIGKQLDETLLEKAVKLVAAAGGIATPTTINHYDFLNSEATNLLLIAEDKADGNVFTLNLPSLPSGNTYFAKSYAFYQSYSASFTIDNDTIDQVSFVTTNADFVGEGVYGTIFGHFGAPYEVDIPLDVTNSYSVWSDSLHAFGALAIEHDGAEIVIDPKITDADAVRDIVLVSPGELYVPNDFTPTAPDKIGPEDLATGVGLAPTLSWNASTAPNYEYCIDTTNDTVCDTGWIATSETSVDLANLFYETTYYWQVRADNSLVGEAYADEGTWWSFTTEGGAAPEAFVKNEEVVTEKAGSPSKVTLSWASSYGTYYFEYCLDTEADCSAPEVWHNVGLATSVTVGDLAFDETYYWQVRAANYYPSNGGGVNYTYADGETVWSSFDTRTFGKLRPTDNVLISYTSVPLEWEASAAAVSYEYCVSTTDLDLPCTVGWENVGGETKATLTKQDLGTTFYWQVRALTAGGAYIYANDGDWWTFTTPASKRAIPTLFKVSPVDGAVDVSTTLTLDWKDYKKFESYQYCYFAVDDTDTTPISDDDTCTLEEGNWVDTGRASEAEISGLEPGTTYYWQARVLVGTTLVYGDHDEYWSFTTVP